MICACRTTRPWTQLWPHAEQVIPVFVLDPALMGAEWAGEKRVAFLLGGLRALDADLRARGSALIVRQGEPQQELAALLAESGASAIYAEADIWPYGAERDARVAAELPLHLCGGLTVHPTDAVLKADGEPYSVYTPYSRRWKALSMPTRTALMAAPERFPGPPGFPACPYLTSLRLHPRCPFRRARPRRCAAWQAFTRGDDWPPAIYSYAQGRDRVDLEGTSRLSPYLRFGMLSARQAVVAALEAQRAAPDENAREGAEPGSTS